MQNKSYTYILTNNNGKVMYIGVTANLFRRIKEHISGMIPGFTAKYNVRKLVYYEVYSDIRDAIARETQLKNWKRAWKDSLVEKYNPQREDLFKKLEEQNPIDNLPIPTL